MLKKTVLITGCSEGGIGEALARQFAKQGFHVFAAVRNRSKAQNLAKCENVEVVTLEVTSSESLNSFTAELKRRLEGPGLDVLVNNAGISPTAPILDVDLATVKQIYDVNVFGLLAVTQSMAPLLIKARGKIINISSAAAIVNIPWLGPYASSKAAVTALSETLRLELAPLGVTVVTAMLGGIQSNISSNGGWAGLPSSSLYKSVESNITKFANADYGPPNEKMDDFAPRFVKDILSGASGRVWRGSQAGTARIVGQHAPARLIDSIVSKDSGLDLMGDTSKK